VLTLPATAEALQKPRPQDRVLPNFDSRVGAARAASVPPGVERALERLRRRSSLTLEPRFHPLTRALRLLAAREGPLTGPSEGSPEVIARGFLKEHGDLFDLSETDLADLVKVREYESHGEKIRHVLFEQQVDGIPVFDGLIGVHVDESGRVVFVSNGALADVRSSARGPRLAAEDAIRAAAADVRPELAIEPRLLLGPSGRDRRAMFARGPLKREIDARLVYFPAHPRPRLAWRMVLEPEGFPQAYDILVDAENGQVLYRRNRVHYADGVGSVVQSDDTALKDPRLLDQHPRGSGTATSEDPATGCPPMTGYNTRDLTAPFRDPGTVLSGTGRLSGNNARAYRGSVGIFGAFGTQDSGTWHFEFPFNSAASAETHLFFAANFLHDFFYDLGFDEAAGNFQVDNFGRSGLGGDPLNALARADGRNNATFEPQPEGTSPTMSMFLFDATGCWSADVDGDTAPDLDGDYDSDIFIHEYHHGVSHRLNTNFTGDEADAMGEGGSDFFAYSINGDTKLAEYVAPPDGIRQVNIKTYADWFCLDFFGFPFCEPHDNGEIWANTLWDMREQFRADLVEGSDAAAINEVHQLYIDGLKLSPGSPTMLDMRNAMLQADQNRNPSGDLGGSENYCRMWTVFAGRGMGLAAQDTEDTGDGTVVADFSLPAICPAPPPKPTVTVTATDENAAEAGPDTGTFTVTRTGDTDADLVVSYTVGGTATAGSDYVALSGTVTIPAGAAEATVVVTPLDDTHVEGGETVELDLATNAAYVVGSPAFATVTIVSDDVAPDLVVSSVSAPFTAAAGSSISVTDTTSNQGNDASAASVTRFYLSTDATLDGGDTTLGSRAVAGVAVGGNSNGSTLVTIPSGTATGLYVLIAEADSDHTVAEIQETNNTRFTTLQVGPDLTILSVTGPATAGAGSTITVGDTTKNLVGSAPASVTKYFLSTNTTLDAGDTLLGSRAVPALASGASSTGSITVTVPGSTTPGTYCMIAQADGDSTLTETSETNNSAYVFLQIGPDLTVAALGTTGAAGAGNPLTVNDTTRNLGGAGAPASVTRLYFSDNTLLDGGDTLLASRAVGALAAGASDAGSTTVTLPGSAGTGTHYILAQADGAGTVAEFNETNNVNWTAIQVGPDLAVASVTPPATAGPGSTISVSDSTRNQGGGAAGASVTKLYLSVNATLDGGDTFLGSRSVGPLAAGESSGGATTVTIPAGTGPGTWFVIAAADGGGAVAETSEANNTAYATVQIGPDLVVSSVSAPATVGAGAMVTVGDTTRNQGASAAPASSTRFYLSADNLLDATDTVLGSRSVPAIAAGSSSTGSTTVTIPADKAPGAYFLIAQADAEQTITEIVEINNTTVATVQVGPDLVIAALTGPATGGADAAITVSDTTKNQAAGTTPTSSTKFYLSSNIVLDGTDVFLGGRSVPALGPGATSAASTTLMIPAGTLSGTHYVLAQADGDGAVAEVSETNNTAFALVQIGPDLTISALTVPAAASAGASITVGDTTRNQGGGSSAASTTRFYLSTNNVYEAGDTPLGSRSVPTLGAGASNLASTSVTIPAGTVSGAYFVIAQADGDGTVGETNETNNTAYAPVQVGPDLIVASVTAPATAAAGAPLTVTDTTRNPSSAPAPASSTRFYLSTNTALDAPDILLGSRSVGALAAGASSTASTTVTIPDGTTAGSYYVIAQADGDQTVTETNEANNTAYASVTIGPDLTVTVSAPATGGAGAVLTVSDTTRNGGGAPAGATVTKLYLSADPTLDGSDTLLGSRSVGTLAPASSSTGSTTVTIPAGTATGLQYLLAKADGDNAVTETQEANNVAVAYVQVGPDLTLLSVTAPATAGAGGSVTIGDTTKNAGGGGAAGSVTRFFLSANTILDAGDNVLGSRLVGVLGPADTSVGSTTVTIPADKAPGTYYLITQVDADAAVVETQETNNTSWRAITIGPDLVISTMTGPSTGGAGADLTVNETTRNAGGAAAPASTTSFFLSANSVLDAGDTFLGSRTLGALGSGENSAASTVLTIPPGTVAGAYYLFAQADAAGAVTETSEGNNTGSLYLQIGPDLVVTITAPNSAAAGASITINDTLRNTGGGAAPATTTRFYLSANTLLDASDALLGTRSSPALAAAGQDSGSTVLTITPGLAPATYYLLAKADGGDSVPETAEWNNTVWRALQITP
jgi:subtilase family serine protease